MFRVYFYLLKDIIKLYKNKKKVYFMENIQFEVRLVHKNPVDLIDMANSLIALDNIAKSHISKNHGVRESKILLKGVKEGSDIYQLVMDFGAFVLPLLDGLSTVKEVLEYIDSYKTISSKTIEEIKENKHYNSVDAENIKSFVAPIIADDSNSNIQITVNGDNNSPIIIINNGDAKKMNENADFVKKLVSDTPKKEEEPKLFEKVLIKMYSMKDTSKKVQDSSYCDEIIKGKSVATVIENTEDKKEILANAFNNLFLVDIEVVRAEEQIKLYRVIKLHNIVPNED